MHLTRFRLVEKQSATVRTHTCALSWTSPFKPSVWGRKCLSAVAPFDFQNDGQRIKILHVVFGYFGTSCSPKAFNFSFTEHNEDWCLQIRGRFQQFYFLQITRICLKIEVFICILHSRLKKGNTFFNFPPPLWKPEESAPFSHKKPVIFRICFRYKVKQLSWVIHTYILFYCVLR